MQKIQQLANREPQITLENAMSKFGIFIDSEAGATAIEYALIASAMALALVSAMPALGTIIKTRFAFIGSKISSGS